jgi:phosphoenolpyruvate carboxylase
VGMLGDLVGRVIREQGGNALFERVEAARLAAIRRREGMADGSVELASVLRNLGAAESGELVRAFSVYFQVVNLAERVHRIRRGREWMREGEPQPGSLADTLRQLDELGVDREKALQLFAGSRVEPVFTAHPTETTRRAILDKQERIALELIQRLAPERTPHEEQVSLSRILENVTATWQTEEHPSARPTVAEEREHVLYYVTHVLYRVVPALHEHLDDAFSRGGGQRVSDLPALVRPGSWVGGDMDGNPNVDASTLRDTLRRHRELALEAYGREIAELAGQLTQSASRVSWSDDVTARTRRYAGWFPDVADRIPERHAGMGYRVLLILMRARLGATRDDGEHGYTGPAELLSDVETIAESLAQNRGANAGLFAVRRLVRRIRTFGFHLAALDIRQDVRELRDVTQEILGDPGWSGRPAVERAERLRQDLIAGDLGARQKRADVSGERAARTLDVFRAIGECRSKYGADAIGSYIISMAQEVDDVLTVLWLAALAGLGPTQDLPLDVAPLFETVPDLERADQVLDRMFMDAALAPHIARRGNRQMVMVGYSDSNKDAGIASARWALQRALEEMADVATRHGVTLTVFHGRGGTASRGGGSVERAVAAMPAASLGGRLRLTEQGEVIDANYGLPQIALRNLERMLGSVALHAVRAEASPTPPLWRRLADTTANTARESYRSLVYEDARFHEYFRAGTPIDVIERMAIGSRPATRRSGAGVKDLRAIPWVFSWTQCRAMMPGWYGLGSGLEAARREHGLEALREAAQGWRFLDVLLNDVEMVLAKADLEIAGLYRRLAPLESQPIFDRIRAEYDRTVAAVLEIRGANDLLDSDPTLQRSIRLRNPYVDPMNFLQVDLLARWRAQGARPDPLLDALLSTVNGIARGLQNTG